jgi:transcriptional regulator with XRE-family HTH domain
VVAVSPQKTVLRKLRREREITIAVLARDTKIAESTLSLGERGFRTFTVEQQDTLSKYFGVPKEVLFSLVSDEAVA